MNSLTSAIRMIYYIVITVISLLITGVFADLLHDMITIPFVMSALTYDPRGLKLLCDLNDRTIDHFTKAAQARACLPATCYVF